LRRAPTWGFTAVFVKPEKDPVKEIASFSDRMKASQEAKKALLSKFKPKPHAPDPAFEERQARREAELEAVRAQRAAAKEAVRLAKVEAEQAVQQAALDDELSELEEKRAARKARKAAEKAAARAKKEARSTERRVG
jgi:hypothetical protein